MRDKDLYAQILGIQAPWCVSRVELDDDQDEVRVHVEPRRSARLKCPTCGKPCGGYDYRERRWRHLDTCQYKTLLVARVPRVQCEEHGVAQVEVPWAEPNSRFTALFEALAIDWLKEANTSAVARLLRLTWDAVDGIMSRAVKRGLLRREVVSTTRMAVDETSFKKRHDYVTVVSDLDTGHVVHIADDRKASSLEEYYASLPETTLAAIEVVSMDMWGPYIKATTEALPEAGKKIAFDKFHVAKLLGDAVDKVRRKEHRELMASGDTTLKGTKHFWLQNPLRMKQQRWTSFEELQQRSLRTARAWGIKELAMSLWTYARRGWAERAWLSWYSWAIRSRLDPIKKAARTIKANLRGILNAIVLNVTNALGESLNARIQRVKRMACGYRNRERFRNAIYFHLGGLDLYPATHTNS